MSFVLIDPPTPFDTLATWEAFRARMVETAKDFPDQAGEMIELADREIERIEGETK